MRFTCRPVHTSFFDTAPMRFPDGIAVDCHPLRALLSMGAGSPLLVLLNWRLPCRWPMPVASVDVRLLGDCAAKLFAALRTRNYRIQLNVFLNRRCALVLVLGSILLILVVKLVLQHILSGSE
jgi:hypothetical protein